MAIDFKTVIESLLPRGSAWVAKSGGSFDGLIEGLADSYQNLRDGIDQIARIRDPEQTPILSDLEHEYGVVPDSSLTATERRDVLKGVVYAKPGMGYDHLTNELHKAGFTDLFAYENDPLINPDFYTDGTWSAWCGGEDSFCGGEEAYCGYASGGSGYILINNNSDDSSKVVPEDDSTWHLVFFVGGVKSDADVGWFLLVDGDMEATGTSDWTAGPSTDACTLTKDTGLVYEGTQSLEVELTDHAVATDPSVFYASQDLGVDALDQDLKSAPLMHDAGSQVLYDSGFKLLDKTRLDGENGDSGDVLGLGVATGGTNAADKLAIDFLDAQYARFEGDVSDEGTFSCWAKINDTSRAPTFDTGYHGATGYAAIPEDITINGITESPTFRYEAGSANTSAWPAAVGTDLVIAGSGSVPAINELSPGLTDYQVDFKAAKHYKTASNVTATGSNDIVIEILVKPDLSQAVTSYPAAHLSSASIGWALYHASAGSFMRLYVKSTAGAVAQIFTGTLIPDAWNHLIFFIDYASNGVCYTNGVVGAVVSFAAFTGPISTDSPVSIGGSGFGTFLHNGSVAMLASWDRAAWLDTHLQGDVAKERFYRCCGIWPAIAAGVAMPTTAGRASETFIEKVLSTDDETALIKVAPGWMRVDRVFDKDLSPVQGYNTRPQSTNFFTYSEAIDNAAWSKTNIFGTVVNGLTALGEMQFNGIIADTTDAIHSYDQASSPPATGYHVMSAYVSAGDKAFAYMDVTEVTNGNCFFNLTTGAVSAGAGIEVAYAENKGDDIWRIWMLFNVSGSTATGLIAPADSISDNTFAGDDSTVNLYVYGLQIEKQELPTTYIKTEAFTASRVADILTIPASANVGGASPTIVNVRTEHFGTFYDGLGYGGQVVNISDGTANNKITISSEIESIVGAVVASGSSQALINGFLSTYTNDLQEYDFEAKANKFKLFKARTQLESTDTSGTMPTGLTDIDIGQRYDSTLQFNGLIGRLTISPYGLSRPRGIIGSVKTSTGQGQCIAYDDLFNGGCELRAIGDLDGEIQVNAAPLSGYMAQDTWYHVALKWDYAASNIVLNLYIDGVELGYASVAATDPSISGDVPMILAAAAIDSLAAGGAVTIAAPKSFSEKIHEDQIIEEYNRGVPEENNSGLISEYSSRPEDGDTVNDLVGGYFFNVNGSPTQNLIRGFTEGGASIRFGAGVTGVEDMYSKDHPFFISDDVTFEGWLRIEGGADQTIWTNQGAAGFEHDLTYNATTEKLDYRCVVGATERTVSAPILTDRLTHVVVTRAYTGGNTTQNIYLDGILTITGTNAGAPVTSSTYDELLVGSDGASGNYFYGHIQGIRLYTVELDATEVLARHDAGQTIIETGAYATQTITPTTETTPVTGHTYCEVTAVGDGSLDIYDFAYPVVLYKRTAGDNLRALFVGNSDSVWSQSWQTIDAIVDSVYEIRFMVKDVTHTRPSLYAGTPGVVHYDLLSGGEESPESIIASVDIPEEKRQILERIVMRCKPLHTWAGMVVRYV